MIYGYARVSTDGQTTENQAIAILARFPSARMITETISGASESKPLLDTLISTLQSGDILVVVAMDRLSRTMLQGATLIKGLTKHGITLISLREGLDLSTPMGIAMAQMLFIFAEMELTNIRARTKAGLKRIMAENANLPPDQQKRPGRKKGQLINNRKPLGRKPMDYSKTIMKLRELRSSGMTIRQIAMARDMSVGRVHQLLKGA
jgi:putative DNA-invertase from lambdoid prophage Rac